MKLMLRNIGCLLLLVVAWVSCNDDDDVKMGKQIVNPVRVKEIVGHNEHWGDYTLKLAYENNKISTVERFDKNGRQKGELVITKEQGVMTYSLDDYVYKSDADAIADLDQELTLKYGAGNYSLEDSIPLVAKTIYEVALTLDEESMVTRQKISYFTPKKDFGVGEDFNNDFPLERVETYIYEYDEKGNVLNVRLFVDKYDPENARDYVSRELYKYEYEYHGGKIVANRIYTVDNRSEESWVLMEDRNYTYSGNNLVSVEGDGYLLERNYSDARTLSLNLNGENTSYVLNEYNFLIKSDNGKGEVMNVTYEPGNGNFYHMYRLDREQEGFPVIK